MITTLDHSSPRRLIYTDPHWRAEVTIRQTVPGRSESRRDTTRSHRTTGPLGKTESVESMEVRRAATVNPGCRLRARVPEGSLPACRMGARARGRHAGVLVVGRAAHGARVLPCRGRLDGRARHRGPAGRCPEA